MILTIMIIHKFVPMMKLLHLKLNVRKDKENMMNIITDQMKFQMIYSLKIYAVN